MTIDRVVLAFAGFASLLGIALALTLSPWWLLLSAFVGANMLQASVTGFCPLVLVLKRLGVPPGAAFG